MEIMQKATSAEMLVFVVSSMLANPPTRKGIRLSKFIPTGRATLLNSKL